MKRGGKRNRMIAWVILLVSLCVIAVCGARLWEDWQVYREGDESYERLASSVRLSAPPATRAQGSVGGSLSEGGGNAGTTEGASAESGETGEAGDVSEIREVTEAGTFMDAPAASYAPQSTAAPYRPRVDVPEMYIDFEKLQRVNGDSVAWLYNPGSPIDYPVMRATNYDYYLRHLPDRRLNANGTLFIDYNWTDFSDTLTVIYGHNMLSGMMFGSLSRYKQNSYFKEHPYMYLYTAEAGNFRVDLLYGCVIGAGQWRQKAFMFEENLEALLAYAAHNTTFTSEAVYEPGDRIIALSTCSYEFDNARYVVLGILRPEYSGD